MHVLKYPRFGLTQILNKTWNDLTLSPFDGWLHEESREVKDNPHLFSKGVKEYQLLLPDLLDGGKGVLPLFTQPEAQKICSWPLPVRFFYHLPPLSLDLISLAPIPLTTRVLDYQSARVGRSTWALSCQATHLIAVLLKDNNQDTCLITCPSGDDHASI